MTRIHIARACAALVAAGLMLEGCTNLFKPATPQAPETGAGGNVSMDYSDPVATLRTLSAAIAAKGLRNGKNAYAGGFADPVSDGVGYTTTFDPEVARAYEAQDRQLPAWNLDLEKDFYDAFVGLRTPGYLLRWSEYQDHGNDEPDDGSGTALLHRRYEVFLVDANNSTQGQIAVGIADLRFRKFARGWAITEWVDLVDPAVGVNPSDPDLRSFSYRRLEGR